MTKYWFSSLMSCSKAVKQVKNTSSWGLASTFLDLTNDMFGDFGMTSAWHLVRCGFLAALAGVGAGNIPSIEAQTSDEVEVDTDVEGVELIDRSKVRLKLLLSLVSNEMRAASLQREQLASERDALTRERAEVTALGDKRRPSDDVRLQQIENRLETIDANINAIDEKLDDIVAEQNDLQRRLDEANGIVRDEAKDEETVSAGQENGTDTSSSSSASIWLDGKRQIQEALVYLGGYNALIDGDFGPRTTEAVKTYQQRQSFDPTGTLTDEQEAGLLEEAEAQRTLYGVTSFTDEEMGYRLSYPSLLLSQSEKTSANERRITTTDGLGELIITVIDDPEEFTPLYDSATSTYDVQYLRKRDGWFVVAGLMEEGRIIYDTARRNDDKLVRARLSYPADKRDLWSPFAVIMFNTFETLP